MENYNETISYTTRAIAIAIKNQKEYRQPYKKALWRRARAYEKLNNFFYTFLDLNAMSDSSVEIENSSEDYKAMINHILLKVHPLARMIIKYGEVVPEGEGYDEQEAKQFVSKTTEDIMDIEGEDDDEFYEDDGA